MSDLLLLLMQILLSTHKPLVRLPCRLCRALLPAPRHAQTPRQYLRPIMG